MLIHFAFGKDKENIELQTHKVIDCILSQKRILVSKCEEFIPVFNPPTLPKIGFLWNAVPMLSFIHISFNQLRNSPHSIQYGKFGIVLTNSFLKSHNIRPVQYYTEEGISNDPLIIKWNRNKGRDLSSDEKKILTEQIIFYRKPASLFPNLREAVTTKITSSSKGLEVEYLTYNRYPVNYNFIAEKEYRIVFKEGIDYHHFTENDLYKVITPTVKSKTDILTFFRKNWHREPQAEVYPF